MKTEYEVKILDINIDSMRRKLKKIGAKKICSRNMKRVVFDFKPKNENSWIRLRDNGQKTTLTIKKIKHDHIDGTKELEVEVSHFDDMHAILQKLGYHAKAYQENKRESYTLGTVELEIDSWPKIPPYLEIEAKSIKQVEKIVKLLGYTMEDTTSINTKKIYKQHGIDLDTIPKLAF